MTPVLQGVIRSAGIPNVVSIRDILGRFVVSHGWPGWVAGSLATPIAERILGILRDADGPVQTAELPDKLPDVDSDTLQSDLNSLIARLAVFEDIDPLSLDLVVGLLPAVRESMGKSSLPRQRPPLVVTDRPEAVGPAGSMIVDDLRAFLLEIASDPPRLRKDDALFQNEVDRFLEAMAALPSWMNDALELSPEKRVSRASDWARGLGLIRKRSGKQRWLELTPAGNQWLASDLSAQFAAVYEVLRPVLSERGTYESHGEYFPGIDSLQAYGRGDHRFLGAHVIAMKKRPGKVNHYVLCGPADYQALRDSIDRSFAALPPGGFHRLDSVVEHLVFGEHNPLLLGLGQEGVVVFESGGAVPPVAECLEEAARNLLRALISNRLIPLGCLQTAIDREGWIYVARKPRFDTYFGRELASSELAGQHAEQSRVVVQPDFSIVIIGPNPAPAAELAPFCEREKRGAGHGAIALKLTRESVVRAVARGLKPEEIGERLQCLASNEVSSNVLRQVSDWCGWVRRVRSSTVTVVQCPDAETADRVLAVMKRQAERVNETMVAIHQQKLTATDLNKLRDQGIILEGSNG